MSSLNEKLKISTEVYKAGIFLSYTEPRCTKQASGPVSLLLSY